MKSPEIQRGLQRAGFRSVGFARLRVEPKPDGHAVRLSWDAPSPGLFQVESSTNLGNWQPSQTGFLAATNAPGTVEWTDSGPPSTPAPPFAVPHRFYRVVEMSHVDN
jgi:hypothetical protein